MNTAAARGRSAALITIVCVVVAVLVIGLAFLFQRDDSGEPSARVEARAGVVTVDKMPNLGKPGNPYAILTLDDPDAEIARAIAVLPDGTEIEAELSDHPDGTRAELPGAGSLKKGDEVSWEITVADSEQDVRTTSTVHVVH